MKILYITLAVILVAVIGWKIYSWPVSLGKVKLSCSYMAYACGDCYPQFQINKVYTSSKPMDKSVLGTNLKVIFTNESMEYKMNDLTKECSICFDYYFEGELSKRRNDDFYRLTIKDSFSLKEIPGCCSGE